MRAFVGLVTRYRRELVIGLLIAWLAGALCLIAGAQSLGVVVVLVAGALELLVFVAVPDAARAATRFDGSYASAAPADPEPVEPGARPPAEIRRG